MKTNNTAIIYPRVSTLKQDNTWDSLERQKKECIKYCNDRWIKHVKTFVEVFSWKTSARPILQEAIKYWIENNIWYFIIYDIDRFSREWYWAYSKLKNILLDHWIKLRDTKNIIWETKLVHDNDTIDMSKYKWNIDNPSEMSEMVMSATANVEWNKILQRTISKEILLEQNWFHVRNSNYWYKLKKVPCEHWIWKIQVEDPFEWKFIIEMYELLASNTMTYQEIVNLINLMWYKSRNWNELTIKQMQVYIKKTTYAWIIKSKWTWFKAIKAQYEWLVTIDIWNKANRWKYKISKLENWEYIVLEWNEEVEQPIIKKRNRFNPYVPFRNLVKSDIIKWKLIWWSASNTNRKNPNIYYHIRFEWKNWENINKQEFEKHIVDYFENRKIDQDTTKMFMENIDMVFEENKSKVVEYRKSLKEEMRKVDNDINNIESNICNINPNLIKILETLEKQFNKLEDKKNELVEKINSYNEENIDNLEEFKKFSVYLLEHMSEILKQSNNFEELDLIFKFIFKETPTYKQIVNRTAPIFPIFALNTKKDLSQNEKSSWNLKWQAH